MNENRTERNVRGLKQDKYNWGINLVMWGFFQFWNSQANKNYDGRPVNGTETYIVNSQIQSSSSQTREEFYEIKHKHI